MLTFRQIRFFLAAAEHGKISTAARELGLSQSSLTVGIRNLEETLGVSLFERRAGGVVLTNDGQNFLGYARNIEASVADAETSMQRGEARLAGRIRLGLTYTGAGYFMVPILSRFRRAYPKIEVELVELGRERLEQAVLDGAVDIALMIVSNLSRPEALRYHVLSRSERVLWLSSAHPLMAAPEVSMSMLADEPLVQFVADESDRVAEGYWAAAGVRPNVVFRTTSLEAVRGMVATGAAVTVLAHIVFRPWSLDGGRVEFRQLKDRVPTLDLGLVWRPDRQFGEVEQRFYDYVRSAAR